MTWNHKVMSYVRIHRLDYLSRKMLGEALLAFAVADAKSLSGRVRSLLLRLAPTLEAQVNALRAVDENRSQAARQSIDESRFPSGLEVRLLGFCLLEVFTIEDFRSVESTVNFFPIDSLFVSMLKSARTIDDDEMDGDMLRHQIPGGIIVRDKSLLDPGALRTLLQPEQIGHSLMPSRVLETLPKGVLCVQVFPVELLPSLFMISIYVHLTEEARQQLLDLHNKLYLAPFLLRGLSPQKIIGGSPTHVDSDFLRKQSIRKWKESLRSGVEVALRPLLSGYFSHFARLGRRKLPAVEIYSLRGGPTIPDLMEEWKPFYDWTSSAVTSGWAAPLGMDFVFGETFVSSLAHFQWGNVIDGKKRSVSQLVLWEEACKQKLEADSNNAIVSQSQRVLSFPSADPLMEFGAKMLGVMNRGIALVRVLQGLQLSIDKLRLLAFSRLNKKLPLRLGFRLINRITRDALLLERIDGEFPTERFWPLGLLDLTLFEVQRLRKGGWPDENFTTSVEKEIAEKVELLKNHSSQVQKWVAESLSLRNTKAILWLTIVGLILAIVSVISGWESLLKLASKLSELLGYLMNR